MLLVLIAAGLAGCLGLGAGSISHDRFDPRRVSEEQGRVGGVGRPMRWRPPPPAAALVRVTGPGWHRLWHLLDGKGFRRKRPHRADVASNVRQHLPPGGPEEEPTRLATEGLVGETRPLARSSPGE